MNYTGIIIGLICFLSIGIFHPIVIKGEYYFGKRIWPIFLVVGIGLITGSFFVENALISSALAVIGFSSLWSIHELFEQEKRVKKGWFPSKGNRKSN